MDGWKTSLLGRYITFQGRTIKLRGFMIFVDANAVFWDVPKDATNEMVFFLMKGSLPGFDFFKVPVLKKTSAAKAHRDDDVS